MTESGGGPSLDVTQQSKLPGPSDPNLWLVRCRMGEEKQTAIKLMQKYIYLQNSKEHEPLQIKSIVVKEGLKGYIYMEAYKQAHVKQAIEGISSLKLGAFKQQMIPLTEMPDVLKVVRDVATIKRGSWVRLKRGIYKDDIGQVEEVEPNENSVIIKLIPRIDYAARFRGVDAAELAEQKRKHFEGGKNKMIKKPPMKMFSEELLR